MKPINKILLAFAFMFLMVGTAGAQGWIQGKRAVYSAGVGAAQAVFLPVYDYPGYHRSSQGVSFNISGEYRAHRVIGLGWQTGVNVFVKGHYYIKEDDYYYTASSVGIPFGFKMNVHILEAAQAPIRDRLDVYAGFNVGGGPAFHGDPYGGAYPFFYAGPQVGVRYWVDNKIGLFGELGWGATIFNFGISF